jgi:predicted nicotinamide N-methyase
MKTQIRSNGVRLLLSAHPKVRELKRVACPSLHGNKHWASSWLLMSYFERRGLPYGAHIMEVGCGWGLAGIYCAKRHGAIVTGADVDSEVFPYLRLHAKLNKVEISTLHKGFDGLTGRHLKNIDVLIGADICFWDKMVEPLRRLILRAMRSGVRLLIIADPARSTFDQICEYFTRKRNAEILDWMTDRPHRIRGRILKMITP